MNKLIRYIIASAIGVWCIIVLSAGTLITPPTIGFSIQGATVLEKDTFVIAVQADSTLTGKDVYSFRFGLSYNSSYLEFLGIDSVGPVLTDWGMPTFSNKTAGQIFIAGAGATPLTGNGDVLYLRFRAIQSGGTNISDISGQSYLNEGSPEMTLKYGRIQANARSYPNIYPDNFQVFVGDETQMNVSGGAGPYVYSTADTSIAVISNQTMVKAKAPGITKAYVTDAHGDVSYMTGNIDVRAVKLSVMRSTAWPSDTFYLPLKIEVAPGTKVYSGYFELTYNGNIQGIKESSSPGDFNVSVQNNTYTNMMKVSFASATGITGSGILCYVGFKAINSGNQYIDFQNVRFNENLLAFTYRDYVQVYNLPTLSISPNSGTLMWGETQKITVTNGTPPMQYSVSDTSKAEIDVQGNLKGLSGGTVQVTATDFHGATKTSGDFLILDNRFTVVNSDGVLDKVAQVPISTSLLPPGKAIFDFDGTITFNSNDVDFVGLKGVDGNMLTEYVQTGSSVHIVGATSTGIQSGIICYLQFQLKNTMALNQQTTITLNSLASNENSLHSQLQNGTITRVEQISYRPVANAGLNKSIAEGETVQLDGSGSYDLDNNPLTYSWTAPPGIQLDDSTLEKPSFVAPEVKVNTQYTFTLIVNDGTSDSDPSTVTITVLQVNKPPVANAGPDKSYDEGSSVSLDGSGSYDPDDDVISYKWTSLDGIILFDPLSVSPSFIAPQVSNDKVYRFKLEVADGVLTSKPDTVNITILNLNKKPIAFAGGDQTVNEGTPVQLDGSLSSDPDNDPITFKWIAPPVVTLSSDTVPKPTFTAPMVHLDSVLVIALVVNDGHINSDTDKVSITVKNLNILSTEAQILDAQLTGADSVTIDQSLLKVNMYLPYGTDPRALAPTFQISDKASISPASGSIRNFTSPVSYTVTAEDGVTKKTYSVGVNVPTLVMQRNLDAGWNWISLSAVPPDLKVSSVFSGLTMETLDYVKSATASAVYYVPSGWFGDLTTIPQYQAVMMKKLTAQMFSLTGKEINPTLTSIPVVNGWNRIGYILKGNAAIGSAFDPASLPSGNILLKSKEASAIYYPGSGWVGDLDSLRVLNGYMMKTTSGANLKYLAGSAKLKSTRQNLFSMKDLYSTYLINPPSYEFSANLIGELVDQDGNSITSKGDLLIAYSGDHPRGVTEACFVPDLNRYIFILTMFSNSAKEKMNFRIKQWSSGQELPLSEELVFGVDEVYGGAMQPYPLSVEKATGVLEPVSKNDVLVYPNPVYNKLHISSGSKIHSVTIFGITGKSIQIVSNISENKFLIDTGNLRSGIYFLKIETDNGISVRKLIKSVH